MTTGFYLLYFGLAMLLVSALVYGVVRLVRRKSPISPQYTGALPTPREALREPERPQRE